MNITLYTNLSDKRQLNKQLTEIKTIPVRLKDDTDIMRPIIELGTSNLPPNANYCYIPVFGRYYFINNQAIKVGQELQLTLDIDVLMSWRGFLMQYAQVVAERSSSVPNKLLPDNIPLLADRNIIYKKFKGGSDFFGSDKITNDTRCYVLTVSAGGWS